MKRGKVWVTIDKGDSVYIIKDNIVIEVTFVKRNAGSQGSSFTVTAPTDFKITRSNWKAK